METGKFYYLNPMYAESSYLLAGSDERSAMYEAQNILEDANSPITTRYTEELLRQVIDKGHIDFDDIPKSKGNIRNYSGYNTMMDTLNTMKNLSGTSGMSNESIKLIDTVITAVKGIEALSDLYEKGFQKKVDYVMLEYNTFVYCSVQATTSLLSEVVEFIKGFDKDALEFKLKNTKYRANLFYVEQLAKFNNVTAHTDYRKYLSSLLNEDKDNFTGAMAVGIAAVATVAVMIVPVTRSCIYRIYKMRAKLSEALALQAYFLELNKASIEANKNMDSEKKKKVIKKQEAVRKMFLKLSDKLRIDNAKAARESEKEKAKDDKKLSKEETSKNAEDSPLGDLL